MRKLLIFFTILSSALLILHQNPVLSQDSQVSVQVRAAGMPVITPEPEFTRGLSNTIYWSDAELAVEYYAEASTDGSFVFVSANSGWISEQSYTFTNLDDDTLYFYRVKARNAAATEGLWSDVVSSTQDDNNPRSSVLELDDVTQTAEVELSFEYFDETSGVDEITLYYRRNSGSWIIYATFSAQDSYVFNSLLTGGDGQYDFYTIAIDNVGNVEYEPPHVDADTVVRTAEPPPEPEPEPAPEPEPEPEPPVPVPEEPLPQPTPVENYIYIYSLDGIYVRELDFVEITTVDPVIIGYARPMRTLTWQVIDSSSKIVLEDSVRSGESGYWETKLPSLGEGKYLFEISYSDAGTRYSDSINFEIKRSRIVNIEGYAFPDAVINLFYNNRNFEISKTNWAGYFVGEILLPIDFEGELRFTAFKDDYSSSLNFSYRPEIGTIIKIIFPPILYPAYQEIFSGNTAVINGFAVPGVKIKIFLDGELTTEIFSGDDGSIAFETKKFNLLEQHEFRASQIVNEIESNKSSPALVYVREPEAVPLEPVSWYENQTIEKITKCVIPGITAVGFALQLINLLISFVAAPNVFLRVGLVFDAIFGKRRKKSWGVVYDAYENKGIPFAVVRLLAAKTGKLVQDTITDLKGRYSFSVESGVYTLEVSHPDYILVRAQKKDFDRDKDLSGKYLGGEIKVDNGVAINYDIPMVRKELAKKGIGYISWKNRFKYIMNKAAAALSFGSVIFLIISSIISPSIVNYTLLVLNSVILLLLIILRLSREKSRGSVYSEETKKPMQGVFVRLFDFKEKRLVNSQLTDQGGNFGFSVDDGEYLVIVSARGYEISDLVKNVIMIKDLGKSIKIYVNKGGLGRLNIPLKKIKEETVKKEIRKIEEISEETPFGV